MSWVKKFIPFGERVLVKRLAPVTRTSSGLYLSEDTVQSRNDCEVVAVGSGRYTKEGKHIPISVKVGEKVLVPGFGADHVKINNEEFFIYSESDIIGILN